MADRLSLHTFFKLALKFKVFHVLFWTWSVFDMLHEKQANIGGSYAVHLPDVLIVHIGFMLGVYSIILFAIPKYLSKGRYAMFVLVSLALVLLSSSVEMVLLQLYRVIVDGVWGKNYLVLTLVHVIDSLVIAFVFIAAVTITSRFETEQQNRLLEKEKLQAELNFLQAQINPHFLFNALNSIYVLINLDKALASETLLKFSGLLRYHLYDCKDSFVDIETELNHLKDYVEIESMRIGKLVDVSFKIKTGSRFRKVAPFILLPFIENAFKYVTRSKDRRNFVDIEIDTESGDLILVVINSTEHRIQKDTEEGGIGLKNVVRRLNLIYPEKYKMDITENGETYMAKLTIYGKHDQLHHS